MATWVIWQIDRTDPDNARDIGELVFNDDGTVDVNSDSREFMNFMKELDSLPTVNDEEVSPDDPSFPEALADHILERSEYRYALEEAPEEEDEADDDEDDGQMALPIEPPPTPAPPYSKVRRL